MAGPDLDRLLGPWLDHPSESGVFTDFDGTLAPIVADPASAVALPGAIDALTRLAGRYRAVAVISGRSVAFLAERFGGITHVPDGIILVGLYGLERLRDGVIEPRSGTDGWAERIEELARRADRQAPPGVLIERKGLALGLHARQNPSLLRWIEEFTADVTASGDVLAAPGKMAYELRPPVDIDKGGIVEELAAGLAAVCFAGDDVGDLPAFAALRRLRADGVTTLAVAAMSDESPPALGDAADLVVEGPAGVLELWEHLAARF